jgi:hypothetical protein
MHRPASRWPDELGLENREGRLGAVKVAVSPCETTAANLKEPITLIHGQIVCLFP